MILGRKENLDNFSTGDDSLSIYYRIIMAILEPNLRIITMDFFWVMH